MSNMGLTKLISSEYMYNYFITVRAYAKAVLGVVNLSVRLSVCLSHAWIVINLNGALQIF